MTATSGKLMKGATGDWEVVIGMEIHAQVTSKSKLFSGASTAFGGDPNSHVSLVDVAMPGMLPVINEECVRQAVRTIRCEVDRARERGDIDGHIWNLGHGVLPTTDAEAITRAVSIIHEEG